MGVITNTKQILSTKVANMAKKTADRIATTSVLSPKQMAEVENRRAEYLADKPDMASDELRKFLKRNLGAVGIEVYQAYLEQLKDIYSPVDVGIESFKSENRIRCFEIIKWLNDAEEKSLDKLVNVYQVLSEEDCNIALIYNRTQSGCTVSIGVVNTDEKQSDPAKVRIYVERLSNAIMGNFPGVGIKSDKSGNAKFHAGIPACLKQITTEEITKSVAIVSNLASEKSEGFISQSMEKLLDGMVPKSKEEEYTIVLLAKPMIEQLEKENHLFELYSALSPYAVWQTNYTYTESDVTGSFSNLGVNIGFQNLLAIANKNRNHANINFGMNFARSSNVSVQTGMNDGIIQNYTNYGVQHTLEMIEKQLKRLEQSSALGMWEFAAYFIAESPVMANNVAHMYLALTQGEESFMTRAAVNLYDGEEEKDKADIILRSVQRLEHPIFGLNNTLEDGWLLYPTLVTPSADLSGKELARALNFPRKSVSGLPVLESASFGRDVKRVSDVDEEPDNRENREISIGNIYHMRHKETTKVGLDIDSLTSHVFVTGSTGAGKSNAIYQMISSLIEKGKKVLIIEPAKGEYKTAMGTMCHAYGTNPLLSDVLKINPFSFPTGAGVRRPIHILEHIDRLIEILNACWPMYAAMPAVLKDSVERAYINKGWDLYTSECYPLKFPTFADLLETLPEVMRTSLYSKDTQSDYAGALVTRINSLTNGINGLVFCAEDEISNQKLFEQNVIIDISRVGSNETKSMLMGIVIMKLQEYHMSNSGVNEGLHHVTVLEEAHNLLRRMSGVQSQESANLQGKSVEMLANSIAEMRTYGEGFIIADQAPGLLDESVIRNTNTKIIFRLPDAEDRQLVGKAAALKDIQIEELSKLPLGVAAVYQNDWVEAVLCQYERFSPQMGNYEYPSKIIRTNMVPEVYFEMLFHVSDLHELSREDTDAIANWIDKLLFPTSTKCMLRKVLQGEKLSEKECRSVAYNLFKGKQLAQHLRDSIDSESGIRDVDTRIQKVYNFENKELVTQIRQWILQYVSEHGASETFENRYIEFMGRRRM